MTTILTAAFLLCFVGLAAHASYPSYMKWVGPDKLVEQCDALSLRLLNAADFYLQEPFITAKSVKYRAEAAQIATLYQTICKD